MDFESESAPAAGSSGMKSAWSNGNPLKTNSKSSPASLPPPPGMSSNVSNNANANGAALRDRFLHLTQSCVGQNVTLTTISGNSYQGVFHTSTPFPQLPADKANHYVIKAVKTLRQVDNSEKISEGATLIIPVSKVSELKISSLRITSSSSNTGKVMSTDTEISRLNDGGKERDLVAASSAWVSEPTADNNSSSGATGKWARGLSLSNPSKDETLSGKIGKWDQFAANKQKFGVEGSYDENLYTTRLDKEALDASKIKRAEQLAKEIESSSMLSGNIHMEEERGKVMEGDYDEEDLYSGVLGKNETKKDINNDAAATETKKDENVAKSVEDKPVVKESATPVAANTDKEPSTSQTDAAQNNSDEKKTEEISNVKSKLNPNAKSFSFNPSAKEFTPSASTSAPQQQQVHPLHQPVMPASAMYAYGAQGMYNAPPPSGAMMPMNHHPLHAAPHPMSASGHFQHYPPPYGQMQPPNGVGYYGHMSSSGGMHPHPPQPASNYTPDHSNHHHNHHMNNNHMRRQRSNDMNHHRNHHNSHRQNNSNRSQSQRGGYHGNNVYQNNSSQVGGKDETVATTGSTSTGDDQ